jgi:hypothetical protein
MWNVIKKSDGKLFEVVSDDEKREMQSDPLLVRLYTFEEVVEPTTSKDTAKENPRAKNQVFEKDQA